MAPMTRNRADGNNVPTSIMIKYYEQRASAGLIVTEGSQISPDGIGYPNTPGIHTQNQVKGWKPVTSAVRAAGGRIFLQLWHVGRISHPLLQPNGILPIAPSALAPKGQVYTPQGMKPFETPRALEINEIPGIIEKYRHAAKMAQEAGFDGVEIHGANGYLIDQFLRDGTNKRTDAYGGSAENRSRFLVEVTEAVIGVWGKEHVGVRLSPGGTFNDMSDSNTEATFRTAIQQLSRLGIVYLHLREPGAADLRHGGTPVSAKTFRSDFKGTLIVNEAYDAERAEKAVTDGFTDLVAFGVPYLANPDLSERFRAGAPLNKPDTATFYGGGEKGYTDYPALAAVAS